MPEKVRDGIRTLISSWPLTAAYVHGTYLDVLAANNLATALCPFFTPGRNAMLDAFTEPEMRELGPDWDVMTVRAVLHLRSIAGAETGDPRLVELVGELSLRSERFRALWARQDVKHKATGTSLFNHPPGRAAGAQLRKAAHPWQRHAGPGHLPRPPQQRLRRTPAPARQQQRAGSCPRVRRPDPGHVNKPGPGLMRRVGSLMADGIT